VRFAGGEKRPDGERPRVQFGGRVRFAEGKKRPDGERPRVQFGGRVRFAEGKKRLAGERPRVWARPTLDSPHSSNRSANRPPSVVMQFGKLALMRESIWAMTAGANSSRIGPPQALLKWQ